MERQCLWCCHRDLTTRVHPVHLDECRFETSKRRKIHTISWETISYVDNANGEVGSSNSDYTSFVQFVGSAGLVTSKSNALQLLVTFTKK